jgi:galactonate dehydratase
MLNRRTAIKMFAAAPLAIPFRVAAQDLRPPGKVKITGFDIHKVSLRWRDLMFLEVHTDAGITGLGEATLESRTDIAEAALRWLEPEYVGLDPAGPEKHWNRSYYLSTRWRNGPALMTALSAVDQALWDIEGKRLGLPLHRLLGGALQDSLRVYFTHWDASIERSKRGQESMAELAAVSKVFGSKAYIGLECADTFSVRSAIEMAHAIAPYRPLFLEEPVLRENPAALGEIAEKSPVPIASGEGLFSRFEFKQLLDAKGASIIQPDVMHAGGVTELRKIANMAEAYGAEVAPHQCSGPIGHLASLATMSVCRNFLIHEWEAADDELYREITEGTYPTQKNGVVRLPDAPGIGVRVNFAEFKRRCPYKGVRSKSMMRP